MFFHAGIDQTCSQMMKLIFSSGSVHEYEVTIFIRICLFGFILSFIFNKHVDMATNLHFKTAKKIILE